MPAYRLTVLAEQDVLDIWLYIAEDNLAAADRLVDRFTEAFQLLANNPGMGEKVDQYRRGLRAWGVGNYVVFFQKTAEGIDVYRVLHGARDAGPLL
jgi:toxin ParE1/3/4